MCIQRNFIHIFERTYKFSIVLLMFKRGFEIKCSTKKNYSKIYEDAYRLCKNNVEMHAKLKSKLMKIKHYNVMIDAGIIRFYVRYLVIVNNNNTKVVHFLYTPDIMSRASLHTRYKKILISWGQQNYIERIICVCTNIKVLGLMSQYVILCQCH